MSESLHKERLKVANAKRLGSPEDVEEAQRNYYTKFAIQKLEEILAKAPPLTPEQVEQIVSAVRIRAVGGKS